MSAYELMMDKYDRVFHDTSSDDEEIADAVPAIVDTTFDKYVTKTIKSTDKDGSIQSIKPDFPALSLSACKDALQLTAEDAANVLTIASRLSPD